GKFWQGTGEKGKHAELSAKFIRQYLPNELQKGLTFVAGHHDYEQYTGEEYRLLKILVLADWLSSGERIRQEGEGKRKETPMLSIFSEVKLNGKGLKEEEYKYIIPSIYSIDAIAYPKKREEISKDLSSSYKAVWESFISDVKNIKMQNMNQYFTTLFYILQKHTAFIPSAVYTHIPDISLFDHSKMTCAIAECLYKMTIDTNYLDALIKTLLKEDKREELSEEEKRIIEEKKFLLIGGDISGIQKFIYTIISKKAAKGLKGRSFYLELLNELIATYILEKLNLPITNLIYCEGGHFYILAPLGIDIEELRKDISKKLFDIHRGRLYLALEAIPLSPIDFKVGNFGKKWKELIEILNERKKRKFEEIMESVDLFEPIEAIDVCQICGGAITKEEERKEEIDEEGNVIIKCVLCYGFEKLAKKLQHNYLIITKADKNREEVEEWNIPFSYFGYRLIFDNKIPNANGIKMVYKINDTDFVEDVPYPIGYRFYLKTSPKELNELAESADGLKRWAVLRGDVDNLGKIFSVGLEKDITISRISTLSTMLSFFFKGWINNICKSYEEKIYGIYSGGDDFFIVGSWHVLPDLAERIYREFRKFTCKNPAITLSTGISIAPSVKYPIYKIAYFAGEELDGKAKRKERKDAIAFLGKAMKWEEEFYKLKEFKKDLVRKMNNGVSKGFLQRLYVVYHIYTKMVEKNGEKLAKYDDRYGRWKWILAYILAREKGIKNMEDKDKFKKMVKENIDYLNVGVRWVEYLKRGE
ncbi:MAG: type III-A CRISPR-associated protein Cas10/Csm1, partial [Deltaproteobacteria bacterium]